jgi:hypothetical protein
MTEPNEVLPTFEEFVKSHTLEGMEATTFQVSSLTLGKGPQEDPMDILKYLKTLGFAPTMTPDELFNDIEEIVKDGDEELGAFRVQEGVVVTIASHGAFVLYRGPVTRLDSFEAVATRQGWTPETQVIVLLRYIENQDSQDVFLDFLQGQIEEEEMGSEMADDGEGDEVEERE